MRCWFLLLLLSLQLFGEVFTESVSFSTSDLSFKKVGKYDIVWLNHGEIMTGEGEPQLPLYPVHISIPADAVVQAVKIVSSKSQNIKGKYRLYPSQPPRILSIKKDYPLIPPDKVIYSSSREYPGKIVKGGRSGFLGGYKIYTLFLYPLQYIPKTGSLILYTNITFELIYERGKSTSLSPKYRSENGRRAYDKIVKGLVINPVDAPTISSYLPKKGYEYVIITNASLASAFEPLAQWKTSKGIPTVIRTTDWIYSEFDGRDNQEKIRNFLKVAYSDSGLIWVLLGGDENVIPSRVAYAMTCGANFADDEDSLHADLYYSDLDGSWDKNNNDIFGELQDSVDMYPDVFVGRAPVNTTSDVDNFVNKVLLYEKSPPLDYETDALFFAMVLWENPRTDGAIHKDMIDDLYMPDRFNIQKLYQSLGNENSTSVINAINDGKNLLNHNGHGWIYLIGAGPNCLSNDDMDNLANGNRQGILYSLGCWTGAFDYDDCIGEHFVNARGGGGVAYIGNSRYGWGSPGNPGYGYSDIFDNQFYHSLFQGNYNIGKTLAESKAYYAEFSQDENVYRWCEYEINLLGDPEMPIWTDTPKILMVSLPDSIPVGNPLIYIMVQNNENPIKGALVTLTGDNVYERDYTHSGGEVSIPVETISPGYVKAVITAQNFIPYVDSIKVFTGGPCVRYSSHILSNELTPGDTVTLSVVLQNFGNAPSDSFSAVLRADDTLCQVIDSIGDYKALSPGEKDTAEFKVFVFPEAEDGHTIYFRISAFGKFCDIVRKPVLQFIGAFRDKPVYPGSSAHMTISCRNIGHGEAKNVNFVVHSLSHYITIVDSNIFLGDIEPDSIKDGNFSFDVSIAVTTPWLAPCEVKIDNNSDTFAIPIGDFGFSDDFESGDSGWLVSGDWVLTSRRSHSGDFSFYCGDTTLWQYRVDRNDSIVSPLFVIEGNSKLKFWHWFELTALENASNGPSDGLYIGVKDKVGFYLLDFIGSGGDLGSSLSSLRKWAPSTYDLSFLPSGDTVQIVFRFSSNDSLNAEGWYIDDIYVYSPSLGSEEAILPGEIILYQNYPNPFSTKTVIRYRIQDTGYKSQKTTGEETCIMNPASCIQIYDLSGRLIKTLDMETWRQGEGKNVTISPSHLVTLSTSWDGRDEAGKLVSGGVYFVRLDTKGFHAVKKIVLIR